MGNKVYEIICEDNACSECKKYGGIFSEKPKHIPPFHPNCRCEMIETEETNKLQLDSGVSESNSNVEDVIKIKKRLYDLGFYNPENFEKDTLSPYPNTKLFDAIADFQKDLNLPITKTIQPNDMNVDAIDAIFNTYDVDLVFEMKKNEEFQKLVKYLLKNEGGYKPADGIDRGGETNFGISELWYPNEDIKNMNRLRASYLYYKDYYMKPKIYKLPLKLREIVFDNAANQGQPAAIRNLQSALGVKVDGAIGPETLNAVKNTSFEELKIKLIPNIKQTYEEIFKVNPEFGKKYGKGLRDRVKRYSNY